MANGKTEQGEINAIAWKACDIFRGVVDPSEYKSQDKARNDTISSKECENFFKLEGK